MSNEDIVITARFELEQARKQLASLRRDVQAPLLAVSMAQEKVAQSTTRLNNALGKSQFQGWALSIMFFGQALKGLFNTIWQAGSKTFNDVMHSVENTVTGFDTLNNSITYLGFVIGQALEPVANFLAPIIDSISEWIANNQELFASLAVIVGVLGTLLTLVGGGVLAISGLATAWTTTAAVISTSLEVIGGALAVIGAPVLLTIALIAAAIAALVLMWQTNFGGLQDFLKGTFGVLWEFIKSIFSNIGGALSGIIKVLKGVFTGDFTLVWEGLKDVVLNVLAILVKAFLGLGAVIINIFKFVDNLIIDIIGNTIKLILGMIAKLASAVGLDTIASNAQDAIKMVSAIQSAKKTDYITGDTVAKYFGGADKLLGTSSGSTTTNNTTINNYITASDSRVIEDAVRATGARS